MNPNSSTTARLMESIWVVITASLITTSLAIAMTNKEERKSITSMMMEIEESLESVNKSLDSVRDELLKQIALLSRKETKLPVLRGIEPKTVQYDAYEIDI